MPANTPASVGNDLIDGLPVAEKTRLLAWCQTVVLDLGAQLCDVGEDFEYAWFPLTGLLISRGANIRRQGPLDMGLIGDEGMLGATIALGVDRVPLRAVVSGAGTALRVSAAELRLALREGDALRQRIDQYLYTMFAELAWIAACNRYHAVEPRFARCLLLLADRAATNRIQLTHEALAAMLGVRRSGVTIAARNLRERGLIDYTRGELVILDRDGLKATACTCYADWPSPRHGTAPI